MPNSTPYQGEKPIYSEVILKSKTGESIFDKEFRTKRKALANYFADPKNIEKIKKKLTDEGFTVIATSPYGLSIIGPHELYRKFFKTEVHYYSLKKEENENDKSLVSEKHQFFLSQTPLLPEEISQEIERIYIPPALTYNNMPTIGYYHLTPPKDLADALNATPVQQQKNNYGDKVVSAMVDSGLKANHEYYQTYTNLSNSLAGKIHGFNIDFDNEGHGTAMVSNMLAIAPKCDFNLYKIDDRPANPSPKAAFDEAVQLPGVKVISCSWSLAGRDSGTELSINTAIQNGITVLFAVGNKKKYDFQQCITSESCKLSFPGCMPLVISVGGVNRLADGTFTASDFARSGSSACYATRPHCPDLCGLCGPKEAGILILMPTQAGSVADVGQSIQGDGTPETDGWIVASGTSAATAQVAGVAALMLKVDGTLSPAKIKEALIRSAVPVTTGVSATDESADKATGAGIVNAEAAVARVTPPSYILRCRILRWIYYRLFSSVNQDLRLKDK